MANFKGSQKKKKEKRKKKVAFGSAKALIG
jgi:hypothetical protein